MSLRRIALQTEAICNTNRLLLPINRDRNDNTEAAPYFPIISITPTSRDWNTVNFVKELVLK